MVYDFSGQDKVNINTTKYFPKVIADFHDFLEEILGLRLECNT
jgi:hypothetical protein